MTTPGQRLRAALGARIRAAREQAGLSQVQLADRLKVSKAAVSQWEHGQVQVSLERQLEIAAALGVNPGAFDKRLARLPARGC